MSEVIERHPLVTLIMEAEWGTPKPKPAPKPEPAPTVTPDTWHLQAGGDTGPKRLLYRTNGHAASTATFRASSRRLCIDCGHPIALTAVEPLEDGWRFVWLALTNNDCTRPGAVWWGHQPDRTLQPIGEVSI